MWLRRGCARRRPLLRHLQAPTPSGSGWTHTSSSLAAHQSTGTTAPWVLTSCRLTRLRGVSLRQSRLGAVHAPPPMAGHGRRRTGEGDAGDERCRLPDVSIHTSDRARRCAPYRRWSASHGRPQDQSRPTPPEAADPRLRTTLGAVRPGHDHQRTASVSSDCGRSHIVPSRTEWKRATFAEELTPASQHGSSKATDARARSK